MGPHDTGLQHPQGHNGVRALEPLDNHERNRQGHPKGQGRNDCAITPCFPQTTPLHRQEETDD